MESPLGALRYYLQRWQGSHLWNEVPHLFSAPSPSSLLNLSLFTISIVTSPVLGLVSNLKRKLLACKEMHGNKALSPFLIYSNGPYGISTVTSIRGNVLIFNIVVREENCILMQIYYKRLLISISQKLVLQRSRTWNSFSLAQTRVST